jgi:hypothetical protein
MHLQGAFQPGLSPCQPLDLGRTRHSAGRRKAGKCRVKFYGLPFRYCLSPGQVPCPAPRSGKNYLARKIKNIKFIRLFSTPGAAGSTGCFPLFFSICLNFLGNCLGTGVDKCNLLEELAGRRQKRIFKKSDICRMVSKHFFNKIVIEGNFLHFFEYIGYNILFFKLRSKGKSTERSVRTKVFSLRI